MNSWFIVFSIVLAGWAMTAESSDVGSGFSEYRVQPGDLLLITVWREDELRRELRVRPDGGFAYPLAGDLRATGLTVEDLRQEITEKLLPYLPNPVVTVSLREITGNRIYVIGRVNRPGEFSMVRPVNVIQALAMAGGLTPYADEEGIRILRGQGDDQKTMRFDYSEVQAGRQLVQNRLLLPGDVVIVP
ncbi:MAG: polysaccharide biosynthesis/export family protein [Pseudomonadota bacterium]